MSFELNEEEREQIRQDFWNAPFYALFDRKKIAIALGISITLFRKLTNLGDGPRFFKLSYEPYLRKEDVLDYLLSSDLIEQNVRDKWRNLAYSYKPITTLDCIEDCIKNAMNPIDCIEKCITKTIGYTLFCGKEVIVHICSKEQKQAIMDFIKKLEGEINVTCE